MTTELNQPLKIDLQPKQIDISSENYQKLLIEENKSPDNNEIILVGDLSSDSFEFKHLQSAGVDIPSIKSGRLSRGQLLNTGFVFFNKIGGGEKPILNECIEVRKGDTRNLINFSSRVLLTQTELDAVKEFQINNNLFFSDNDTKNEIIREDMMKFLEQAVLMQHNLYSEKINLFHQAQRFILENDSYSVEDRTALVQFFTKSVESSNTSCINNLSFVMQECVSQIEILKLRGIPFEVLPIRLQKLKGAPSPFLNSGFHFDENLDITLFPNNPRQTKRLNMVNIHLLSGGINEMGGSLNGSHDQTYLTAREYETEIFLKRDSQNNGYSAPFEDIRIVADRLIARVNNFEI